MPPTRRHRHSQSPPRSRIRRRLPKVRPTDELDLSSLPPIDSITAATDITAFLRKGIPPELSRAALRRAWAPTPPSATSWVSRRTPGTSTTRNAMPGFGPLDCSDRAARRTGRQDRRGRAQRRRQPYRPQSRSRQDASQTAESSDRTAMPILRASEAVADAQSRRGDFVGRTASAPAAAQPEASQS